MDLVTTSVCLSSSAEQLNQKVPAKSGGGSSVSLEKRHNWGEEKTYSEEQKPVLKNGSSPVSFFKLLPESDLLTHNNDGNSVLRESSFGTSRIRQPSDLPQVSSVHHSDSEVKPKEPLQKSIDFHVQDGFVASSEDGKSRLPDQSARELLSSELFEVPIHSTPLKQEADTNSEVPRMAEAPYIQAQNISENQRDIEMMEDLELWEMTLEKVECEEERSTPELLRSSESDSGEQQEGHSDGNQEYISQIETNGEDHSNRQVSPERVSELSVLSDVNEGREAKRLSSDFFQQKGVETIESFYGVMVVNPEHIRKGRSGVLGINSSIEKTYTSGVHRKASKFVKQSRKFFTPLVTDIKVCFLGVSWLIAVGILVTTLLIPANVAAIFSACALVIIVSSLLIIFVLMAFEKAVQKRDEAEELNGGEK